MQKIDKKDAVKIIHDCSVLYSTNLSGKNILFIGVHGNKAVGVETLFMPQNYMHLTGVKTRLNGDQFFRAAYSNKLSQDDITLMPNGITEQKLYVLPRLMSIHTTARMIGDYDNSMPLLITDKFAGTVTMAMGFVGVNGVYIPNTALKKDIRDIIVPANRSKVAAIFIKPRGENLYKRLTYISKTMSIYDDILASIIEEKVDKESLNNALSLF